MKYAILFDIGTTNIQGSLIDLEKKKNVDYINIPNSLSKYGRDVITRFAFSLQKEEFRLDIKKTILRDINLIINNFIKNGHIDGKEISIIAACGNTAMHHACLGLSFATLLRAPFKPVHSRVLFVEKARKFGIDIKNDEAQFRFLPNIDGFVGSDAFCVIIATKIYKSKRVELAIDMGTNGEIIMGYSSKILVASTSAGPAFQRRTLYGSEMIDAVSSLIRKGIVDKTGFMRSKKANGCEIGKKRISVSQEDIRNLQLAKAAITGGIKVLKEKFTGFGFKNIFITGLFGTYLNKSNARIIGILPKDTEKITVIERAALKGLKEIICNPAKEEEFLSILEKIQHVELHKEKAFFPHFTESLIF